MRKLRHRLHFELWSMPGKDLVLLKGQVQIATEMLFTAQHHNGANRANRALGKLHTHTRIIDTRTQANEHTHT